MANTKKNVTDFMVSGDLGYCGINTPRKSKVSDESRYLTILNPIITNPWKMDNEIFTKAQKLLETKFKTDEDNNLQYVVIPVKGKFPVREVFDKKTNKAFELPTDVNENGEKTIREPINTHADIDVQLLYSEEWSKDYFTFAGMQVPDAASLEFYERSNTGMFGATTD